MSSGCPTGRPAIRACHTAGAMPLATVLGLSLSGILRRFGYAGLVVLMLAETVFPPIPSEAVLPLAGYLVERGELGFVLVLVTSTAGSVLGAMVLYEAARRGGRPFAERFLRLGRLSPEKLDEAEGWFAKRGAWVVLAGRCVPGVRSLVSLPAGLLRMPRWQYAVFTLIGSAVWNTVLVGAGYALGSQWERVSDVIGAASTPILVATAVLVGGLLLWRGLRARGGPEGSANTPD
jgi:membrane protein DedA with SNARE-associated domain